MSMVEALEEDKAAEKHMNMSQLWFRLRCSDEHLSQSKEEIKEEIMAQIKDKSELVGKGGLPTIVPCVLLRCIGYTNRCRAHHWSPFLTCHGHL